MSDNILNAIAALGDEIIPALHAQGLSHYKISADLKERGPPLSRVTVSKVIAGRPSSAATSAS
jgi:hypothetical protein